MNDQLSFESGYAQGLTGELPEPDEYLHRFAYVRGWVKGFKGYSASLPARVVTFY